MFPLSANKSVLTVISCTNITLPQDQPPADKSFIIVLHSIIAIVTRLDSFFITLIEFQLSKTYKMYSNCTGIIIPMHFIGQSEFLCRNHNNVVVLCVKVK